MAYTVTNTRTHETAGSHDTLSDASWEWLRLGGRRTGWRIQDEDGSAVDAREYAVTDDQIVELKRAAGQAGDHKQVELCDLALDGDAAARAKCSDAISDAVGRS